MTDPRRPQPSGVSAWMALGMATILFFALVVLGFGIITFFTDRDIIATSGLGQVPGILGMLAALIAFIATLRTTLVPPRPAYPPVLLTALATPLAHLFIVWIAVLIAGHGFVTATSVAADLVRYGSTLILFASAAVSAWTGVALRRTRAHRPQWPWEGEDNEPDAE